jgi:Domain of unknown function (DUF6457)
MSEWIDELAEVLQVEALTTAETGHILRVARDVAHRVERKETPLAAFLLGMHVARRTADGTARDMALDDAIATTDALLPPTAEQP